MKILLRTTIARTAMTLFGRRLVARVGRAITREARLDVENEMSRNGELLVQRTALKHGEADPNGRLVFVDAGANVGHWTLALQTHAALASSPVEVFAFEPSQDTMDVLERNLRNVTGKATIHRVHAALSNAAGEAILHVASAGAGINSLHQQDDIATASAERITCVTLDEFCAGRGIARILLLKVDTEGHEMSVFEGATGMFDRHAIDLVQFEYNQRWIYSRHYLRDAFEFLQPRGYRIGKITSAGIEFYDAWHFELETWNEGNYLACAPAWLSRFPIVKWWNA